MGIHWPHCDIGAGPPYNNNVKAHKKRSNFAHSNGFGIRLTSAPRAHTPCASSVLYNIEAHLVFTRVLKPYQIMS